MKRLTFVWNIPNILSLVRLALLPVFTVVYLTDHLYWALAVLAISGLTDLFDGWIARRFNQITEIGKLLDPVADKLTQIAVLVCLTVRIPSLFPLFLICCVKEAMQAIGGWILFSRNAIIRGAKWFGKVSTFTFYIVMLLFAVWAEMPPYMATVLIVLVAGTMLLALVLYFREYLRLRREKATQQVPLTEGD